MLYFSDVRTTNLSAQLREISIIDSIALANIPARHLEKAITFLLLKAIVSEGVAVDTRGWTVQERMLASAYYLAGVLDNPDFEVGNGSFLDYLDGKIDFVEGPVDVGVIGNDTWTMRQLTGYMGESIERLQGNIEGVEGRMHWLLGCMSSQLVMKGEIAPHPSEEGKFDDFLIERMTIFSRYPESDFHQLLYAFYAGRKALDHLFKIDIDDEGIVALPIMTGGADAELCPARFPASHCTSGLAIAMAGKPIDAG